MSFRPYDYYKVQLLRDLPTLSDPNSILVGAATQDASGYITMTLAGGATRLLPSDGVTFLGQLFAQDQTPRQWGEAWTILTRIEFDPAALPAFASDLWVGLLVSDGTNLAVAKYAESGLVFTGVGVHSSASDPSGRTTSGGNSPIGYNNSGCFGMLPGIMEGSTKLSDIFCEFVFPNPPGGASGGRTARLGVNIEIAGPVPVIVGFAAGRTSANAAPVTFRVRPLIHLSPLVPSPTNSWTP